MLLDTHTFIWWDTEPTKLAVPILEKLEDENNQIFLSLVSIWELQVKAQLGKLTLREPLPVVVEHQQANGIQILPISLAHVLALDALPLHHRDPFDRLLIAQSIVDGLTLVSGDSMFTRYSVPLLW